MVKCASDLIMEDIQYILLPDERKCLQVFVLFNKRKYEYIYMYIYITCLSSPDKI